MKRKSINIPLSEQEFEALYTNSQKNLRHPRDQARFILRCVLLSEQTTENKNGDTPTFQGKRVTIGA